ncbi:MAG TPA: hypothetical protein VK821_00360 [Dehalococcoidia bacterium]|nr:hypothetical protein [Dehalococcoidia bacterium]
MKLSISVRDDLWNRAKHLQTEFRGASGLVQAALEEFVRSTAPELSAVLPRPPDAASLLQAAQEHLQNEIEVSYQRGYRQAMSHIIEGTVSWRELQRFEYLDWNIVGWWREMEDGSTRVFNDVFYDSTTGNVGMLDPAFAKGYREAMHDLWASLQVDYRVEVERLEPEAADPIQRGAAKAGAKGRAKRGERSGDPSGSRSRSSIAEVLWQGGVHVVQEQSTESEGVEDA